MKIGLGLGITLNLGNYNSGRVRVDFEDEYVEKELHVSSTKPDTDDPSTRVKLAEHMADDIYTMVENKLIQKVEAFINRLEREGFIGE